jgi:hypothetical protein
VADTGVTEQAARLPLLFAAEASGLSDTKKFTTYVHVRIPDRRKVIEAGGSARINGHSRLACQISCTTTSETASAGVMISTVPARRRVGTL